MSDAFNIELSEHEVVLLNSTLNRLAERPDFERLIPEKGDRQAVQNLIALLERVDTAAFAENYAERLTAARDRVLREP
jgi:hypothetical protein